MEYRIIPFSAKYFEPLVKLLSVSFDMKSRNKAPMIQWRLFNKVHQNKTVTYLATYGDEVVGHYSNIPISISHKKDILQASVCVDMATHPKHRGKGLVSKMAHEVYKEVEKRFDFSIGFSNAEGVKVDKYSKNYHYEIVGTFRSYAKILFMRTKTAYTLHKVDDFTQSIPVKKDFPYFMIHKTDEYLHWKHIQNPFYRKMIYEIHYGDEFFGYALIKEVKNRWYLQDLVLPNYEKETVVAIIKAVENKAMDSHKNILFLYVLDNDLWKNMLPKLAYLRDFIKRKKFYLTVRLHKKQKDSQLLLDKNNWFLMSGDIL